MNTKSLLKEKYDYLVSQFFPKPYSIVSSSNDFMSELLCHEFGFARISVPSGKSLNGWVVPDEWTVENFSLRSRGNTILEGTYPLRVGSNSVSVEETLEFGDLKKFLVVSPPELGKSLIWDWRNLYRHKDDMGWSISLTQSEYMQLDQQGKYEVTIDSRFSLGQMHINVKDSDPSKSDTVILQAHNCHPYQFSDGLSGVIATILVHYYPEIEELPFNIKSVICPELFGTMFFLNGLLENSAGNRMDNSPLSHLIGTYVIASIGNKSKLKVQDSYQDESNFSRVTGAVARNLQYRIYPFRTMHGNDEIFFEAPPFRIPSVTLSRMPFKAYHSAGDLPNAKSFQQIMEAIEFILHSLRQLSRRKSYQWNVSGVPKFDTPANKEIFKQVVRSGLEDSHKSAESRKWNLLMNTIPMLINDGLDIADIANKVRLPVHEVSTYVEEFLARGYIKECTRT